MQARGGGGVGDVSQIVVSADQAIQQAQARTLHRVGVPLLAAHRQDLLAARSTVSAYSGLVLQHQSNLRNLLCLNSQVSHESC